MTEQTQERAADKTYTAAEVDELVKGLKAKNDELLTEKKTVSQRAQELEEAQTLAEQERLKEKQEFKTLYEREQEAKKELAEKYESFAKLVQKKDIEIETSSIASELTRDTKRAALIAKEVAAFARHSENGVTYEMGGVVVDRSKVIDHIKESYPFLVDGSGMTGGGATGGKGNGVSATATRQVFDAWNETQKRDFLGRGGKLTE